MGNQLKPEDIHGKKIIAIAGYDIFGKSVVNMINKEIAKDNLLLIGININDDNFGFFINNLSSSKVEATIFKEEFQKRAGEFFGVNYLLAAYKKDDKMELISSDKETYLDDIEILNIIRRMK